MKFAGKTVKSRGYVIRDELRSFKNGQTFLAFSSNKLYNFANEFFIIASENEFL
jgi:hypothetical protein